MLWGRKELVVTCLCWFSRSRNCRSWCRASTIFGRFLLILVLPLAAEEVSDTPLNLLKRIWGFRVINVSMARLWLVTAFENIRESKKEEGPCVRVRKCSSKQVEDLRTPGMMMTTSENWMYRTVLIEVRNIQERCRSAPKQRLMEGCSVENI